MLTLPRLVRRGLAWALVAGAAWLSGTAATAAWALTTWEAIAPTPDEAGLAILANQSRAAAGLGSVAPADDLVAVARAHARQMAAQGRLFHTADLLGALPRWQQAGEVVARSDVGVVSWMGVVEADFVTSPIHRAVLLSPRFTNVGVGVAYNGPKIYVAEVFGRPSGAPPPPPAPPATANRPVRVARVRTAPASSAPPRLPPSPATTSTTTTTPGVVIAVAPASLVPTVATVATAPPVSGPNWTVRMTLVLLGAAVSQGVHRRRNA